MKEIELSNGDKAYVDDEDYNRLINFNHRWQLHSHGYAIIRLNYDENKKRKTIYMHREILQATKGQIIDHIDGNKLNNCKSNLRFCSNKQNRRNRNKQINNNSGFKGVTWNNKMQQWQAQIQTTRKCYYLGCFDSAIEAAKAYDVMAKKLFEEFAKTNL